MKSFITTISSFLSPFLIIGILITASLFIPQHAYADDSDDSDAASEAHDLFLSFEDLLPSHQYLDLSLSLDGTALQNEGTSSFELEKSTALSWSYATSTSATYRGSLADILSPAVLTFDVYEGEIGSSTLVFSQTVASSTDTPQLPIRFANSGKYIFVYSATFPDGTYPLHKSPADLCSGTGGDFCFVPKYSLADFQTFMTRAQSLAASSTSFGNFIPAAFGMVQVTIEATTSRQKASNVLFLPGTMESRLYMKSGVNEQRVWEPFRDADAALLTMNADGTSKNQLYTRDILDHLYSDNPLLANVVKLAAGNNSIMYGPFENFMDGLVTDGTIQKWQAYPYDWRYDVRDIVQNGTLIGTTTTSPTRIYLQQVVQELASSSPTGKITIVAHSNGGLLAKALAIELQNEGKLQLLDRVIMVGTPQFGTPGAIGSMIHGDGQTRALGFVTYAGTVRSAALTMPGPYDLLPSPAYFSKVATPVVTFGNDALEKNYRAAYGAGIDSFEKLSSFITDAPTPRSQPSLTDLRTPTIVSSTLVEKAKETHDALDTWVPPLSLPIISIAGWGKDTIAQYNYSSTPFTLNCSFSNLFSLKCSNTLLFKHLATTTEDGDDTVIAASAGGNAEQILYFNSSEYQNNTKENIVHQNLLSAAPIQNQIKNLLQGNSATESYLQTTEPVSMRNPLIVVSAHSPVNLMATDTLGNQTGLFPVSALPGMYFIKEEIPGSSVQVLDDEKYLYLPDNRTSYHFALQGYDSGQTTLEIGRVDGVGNTITTQTFSDIPTLASTTGAFIVTGSTSTPPTVDINGDGKIDLVATSSGSNATSSPGSILSLLRERFAFLDTHPLIKLRFFLALLRFRDPTAHYSAQDIYSYFQKLLDVRSAVKPTSAQSTFLLQLLSAFQS
ncbi:hypothetical protein H0X32_01120 [Patescibacteria group bacterium]|nr:hypothetical protein [Patescibacteria group bacterium]